MCKENPLEYQLISVRKLKTRRFWNNEPRYKRKATDANQDYYSKLEYLLQLKEEEKLS